MLLLLLSLLFLLLLLLLLLLLSLLLLLLLLLLLSKVLSRNDQPIMASSQTRRYFNQGSQAVLQRMLSDWACVQRSTVRQHEQHESNAKKDR